MKRLSLMAFFYLFLLSSFFYCEGFVRLNIPKDERQEHQNNLGEKEIYAFTGNYLQPKVEKVTAGFVDNEVSVVLIEVSDNLETSGWVNVVLRSVNAQNTLTDKDISFQGGYLEGYSTAKHIYNYWSNYAHNRYGQLLPKNESLQIFITEQYNWVQSQMQKEQGNGDEYWESVDLLMSQFEGLVEGFFEAAEGTDFSFGNKDETRLILYFLNCIGDLEDLENKFPEPASTTTTKEPNLVEFKDCSAIIRITDDDIIAGHTTWRAFFAMLRVYKIYDLFPHHSPVISMSSSPGLLHSKDDFYTLGNGYVVMETTNGFYNDSLYDLIKPSSLFSWQRVMISNFNLKDISSGKKWITMFEKHGSGTYCNQWMVLDTTLFKKYKTFQTVARFSEKPIMKDVLWIAEEIPGLIKSQDVTDILLDQGFWPSYNIPFIDEIYNTAGFAHMKETKGEEYVYEKCSRRKIFDRDTPRTSSVEDVQKLIRYNDFEIDPLSFKNPSKAISSRYDLTNEISDCALFGGVDSKVVSGKEIGTNEYVNVHAVCGPTADNLPVFSWDGECSRLKGKDLKIEGLPKKYNFSWVDMTYKK